MANFLWKVLILTFPNKKKSCYALLFYFEIPYNLQKYGDNPLKCGFRQPATTVLYILEIDYMYYTHLRQNKEPIQIWFLIYIIQKSIQRNKLTAKNLHFLLNYLLIINLSWHDLLLFLFILHRKIET